jgi:hypothetical protein
LRFYFAIQFLSSFFAPKERRKLASHIVAGLAPANHRVLKERWKTSEQFIRAIPSSLAGRILFFPPTPATS